MGNMDKKTDRLGMMVARFFIGFCLGAFLANHCNHFRGVTKMIADTVVVRDTVRGVMPTEKDEKVVGTVALPFGGSFDTPSNYAKLTDDGGKTGTTETTATGGEEVGKIGSNDTVWATVPRTQKRYEDSTYTAWVSGYEPRLDSIEVYRRTVFMTKTETATSRKRLSLGLTGGFGYGVITRKPDVWLGVGVTWRLW